MSLFNFKPYSNAIIENYLSIREGETKIGQTCSFNYDDKQVKYVIIGISEDLGPQANFGFEGSKNAFNAFIKRFVNIQDNRFLNGEYICIYGEIEPLIQFNNIFQTRENIANLDKYIQQIIAPIIKAGKIPIVIGGGHNNAYPLINASSEFLKDSINVINLDPHADCRAIEGRHSGNPFSYAQLKGTLNHYTVLGLHQQYNNETLYEYLDEMKFQYTFFEDYLFNERSLKQDIEHFMHISSKKHIGIELDLDTIAFMPTSAFTPSGFTVEQARNYIHAIAKSPMISYLHIPEGSPQNSYEEKVVGKTIAYLVTDFIKSNHQLNI
ncbi:MAG: formimidoylglutamase [Flavobacteriia bacterium]|nr:formimidoylglutamase [Flavobacteriia bacterium]